MDKEKKIQISIDQVERGGKTDADTRKSFPKLTDECKTLLNTFNDVVFILDRSGRFIFVNKASEHRTGIPADVLLGRSYLDLTTPEFHKQATESFENAIKGLKDSPFEINRSSPTGEMITMEVNWGMLYKEGTIMGLLGAMRDISQLKQAQTALKKAHDELEERVKERTAELQKTNEQLNLQIKERISAEENLKASEEKYRGLFENSADAVFIVAIDSGVILDANRQAGILTGIPRQKLIGMPKVNLHPDDHKTYYENKFESHISTSPTFDLEAEIVRQDGVIIPVFISSGLINLNGKTVIQEIFRDVSNEKLISDLKDELETKKLVNKAKTIIARHYRINDSDAIRMLQKESRRQSRKIKEVAQAVIASKFIID